MHRKLKSHPALGGQSHLATITCENLACIALLDRGPEGPVSSNKRLQFDMIGYVLLTQLKVFSIIKSKQKPSTYDIRAISVGKCIQIIRGFFLLKILFSKGFFHKMREKPREKPKGISLPRSGHPARDSYLLVARPEGRTIQSNIGLGE